MRLEGLALEVLFAVCTLCSGLPRSAAFTATVCCVRAASLNAPSCALLTRSACCRLHPGGPSPRFAVGPWHVLGHAAACQLKFGARLLKGMGLTFGDNIEHLWARLRRFNPFTKYMSPAARSDFFHALVGSSTQKRAYDSGEWGELGWRLPVLRFPIGHGLQANN